MGFTFDLDPVLQLRQMAVESAEQAVGAAVRALQAARAEAEDAEMRVRANAGSMQSADSLIRWSAALAQPVLAARLEEATARVARAEADLESARSELARCMAERDALHRLRDAQRHRWRREQERREQLATDEAAARQYQPEARRSQEQEACFSGTGAAQPVRRPPEVRDECR